MAAGKSTVAQLLAEQCARSAHIRGDAFRRMIVSGRAEMRPDHAAESLAQLRLRYRLGAMVADGYASAGFSAVVQDVILGPELAGFVDCINTRPRHVVVLIAGVRFGGTRQASVEDRLRRMGGHGIGHIASKRHTEARSLAGQLRVHAGPDCRGHPGSPARGSRGLTGPGGRYSGAGTLRHDRPLTGTEIRFAPCRPETLLSPLYGTWAVNGAASAQLPYN